MMIETSYHPDLKLQDQVRQAFTYHAPQGDQALRYGVLRDQARDLAELIISSTPASREQALALTHLDQVVMFANAAIARNEQWENGRRIMPQGVASIAAPAA